MPPPLQTPMGETSYDLPRDIIETILSRLPFKDLLRFKSVSKSWNSIISDPLFIKIHHQYQSKSSQDDLFIHRSPTSGAFTLVKLQDNKFETVQTLESPDDCDHVICRCEGVLLLTDRSEKQVLWNPSTRTQKQISTPYKHILRGRSRYELCRDPTTDSFKVVIINTYNYSVYSIKNNSFIIHREKFGCPDYGSIWDRAICVDGALYWLSQNENADKIIYFDPRDDKFKVLQKPEYLEDDDKKWIFLVNLGGSLCLYCEGEDKTTIKIWIKEKGIDNNSWSHLITIENVKIGVAYFEPQCLFGNKIVIQEAPGFVVYSPLEKTFETLGEMEFSWLYGYRLIPYVDRPVITITRHESEMRKRS